MAASTLAVAFLAIAAGSLLYAMPRMAIIPPVIPADSSIHALPQWPVFYAKDKLRTALRTVLGLMDSPQSHVYSLATASWQSEVTYGLTKHGVFDALFPSSASCARIAVDLGLDEGFLCRLMNAGEALNLLKKKRTGMFSLAPAGDLLRTGHPSSMAPFVMMTNAECRDGWRATVDDGVRTGKAGFEALFGEEFIQWHSRDENTHKMSTFDLAMKGLSSATGSIVGEWVPPANDSIICDLGGGLGHELLEMLRHYPEMKGILLEKPMVCAGAEMHVASAGLSSRVHVVAGDLLASTLHNSLKTCDVFYLKFILHGFGDSACSRLLSKIADVAKSGARIVTTDFIRGTQGPESEKTKALMDINMMAVTTSGRERSFPEFLDLFRAAGIKEKPRMVKMRGLLSSIEVKLS